jgi:hypothetical protein
MMKTTGNTVVHVLSGPTRQMLRRFPSAGFMMFLRAVYAQSPANGLPCRKDGRWQTADDSFFRHLPSAICHLKPPCFPTNAAPFNAFA